MSTLNPSMGRGTTATLPRATTAGRWRLNREQVFTFVTPLTLVLLWQILADRGVLDRRIFSTPVAVAGLIGELIQSGELGRHTAATLWRLVLGMVWGMLPGLLLGLTMGLFAWPRAILNPLILAIYPLPRIALFPLILIMVGINERSNIIMVAMGPFFTMLISTMAGVMNVDPIYLKVARSFKVNTWDLYFKVVLPAAFPIVFSAIKVSLGLALLGVVSVEFLNGQEGLGYMIWHSWQVLSLARSMAGLLVTGLLGYAMFLALDWLERRVVPWAATNR